MRPEAVSLANHWAAFPRKQAAAIFKQAAASVVAKSKPVADKYHLS